LKAQIHAVLAKCGASVPMSDLFGVAGQQMLDQLRLPDVYAGRIAAALMIHTKFVEPLSTIPADPARA
jgi:hypothetical protein